MSPARTVDRPILGYFYGLIAIGLISVVALVAVLSLSHASEVTERDQLENFHVRSLILASEASQDLGELRARWVTAGDLPPTDRLRQPISLTLSPVGAAVDTITALQDARGEELFAETVLRSRRQYADLRLTVELGDPAPAELDRRLAALDLTLFQLYRLHSISLESKLREIGARTTQRGGLLLLAFAVVFSASALLVLRTLGLVRANLRRQRQVEADLRQRERQLEQTSKMEALGTLVGGVAHDFNNLLTAILANTELLERHLLLDDPRRQELQEITQAGERAAALTRQLLAFSRQDRVEPRVLDLNLSLQEGQALLKRLMPADISLTVDYGDGLCLVELDPVQLEQVFVNLAVNARDSMPGGGELRISTSRERIESTAGRTPTMPEGDHARLSFEDTGCGMDEYTRARVFEPFFTTKEPGSGTGLGLSTVHGIVQRGGGAIEVDSEPGRGTRFDVYLPAALEQTVAAGRPSLAPTAAHGGGTVLLVEDEPQIREVTAAGLRARGYDVLEAAEGEEALRICRAESRIDLIVADIVMPGLRGPAVVEQVRQLHPEARVVYISGYAEDRILEDVLASDAPLVRKPFKLRRLLEVVAGEMKRGDERPLEATR